MQKTVHELYCAGGLKTEDKETERSTCATAESTSPGDKRHGEEQLQGCRDAGTGQPGEQPAAISEKTHGSDKRRDRPADTAIVITANYFGFVEH